MTKKNGSVIGHRGHAAVVTKPEDIKLVCECFEVDDIEMLSKGRLVTTLAKLHRHNAMLMVELFYYDPGHAVFRDMSVEHRDLLMQQRNEAVGRIHLKEAAEAPPVQNSEPGPVETQQPHGSEGTAADPGPRPTTDQTDIPC
jgi:hypothetical protein